MMWAWPNEANDKRYISSRSSQIVFHLYTKNPRGTNKNIVPQQILNTGRKGSRRHPSSRIMFSLMVAVVVGGILKSLPNIG